MRCRYSDFSDSSAALLAASNMHHHVNRALHLMLHSFERKTRCREQCHGVNAVKRVDGAIGMACRKRAVMAGIECLQHIERFGPTNLADNETVGAHA